MSRVQYKYAVKNKDVLRLFFDFYSLNEIWFRTVGAGEYGYAVTKILPSAKEEIIQSTFADKVNTLKREIIGALEASVRHEIGHWRYEVNKYTNWGGEGHHSSYVNICKIAKISVDRASRTKLSKLPLHHISMLYGYDGWDLYYGGKPWQKATDLLIKLKESKAFKDDIFYIDQIFDLQHNTGFILNKTEFVILDDVRKTRMADGVKAIYRKALNFRFKASLKDLVENCSLNVKKIYTANLNYI